MLDLPIDIVIHGVEIFDGSVLVSLSFRNNGRDTFLLDPHNICQSMDVKAPLFQILDSLDRKVKYTGRIYKRGQPKFDFFITIEEASTFETICDIGKCYNMHGYSSPFRIQYVTNNVHPSGDYSLLKSNVFEFNTDAR